MLPTANSAIAAIGDSRGVLGICIKAAADEQVCMLIKQAFAVENEDLSDEVDSAVFTGVGSAIKTVLGLPKASVKTFNSLPMASVKTINELA